VAPGGVKREVLHGAVWLGHGSGLNVGEVSVMDRRMELCCRSN
jgi:hypothetical protein